MTAYNRLGVPYPKVMTTQGCARLLRKELTALSYSLWRRAALLFATCTLAIAANAQISGNRTWVPVAIDSNRKVLLETLRTQRPFVTYVLRVGEPLKHLAHLYEFAVEADCDRRARRDATIDNREPTGPFASVDTWGKGFVDELNFVCKWAHAQWGEPGPYAAVPVPQPAPSAQPAPAPTVRVNSPYPLQGEITLLRKGTPYQVLRLGSTTIAGRRVLYSARFVSSVASPNWQRRAADCEEQTKGEDTFGKGEFAMYSAYPDTPGGGELHVVCMVAAAKGQIAPSSWLQTWPTASFELGEPPYVAVAPPAPPSVAPQPAPAPYAASPAPKARDGSSGSGFLVARQHVVTNEHVAGDCRVLRVKQGDEDVAARLVAFDRNSDLALLMLERAFGIPAQIRSSAALGEDVMVAGYPLAGLLGSDIIVTSGHVNSLAGLGNDSTRIQISAPVQPGNSGGPLVDRSGAVVGVVVSKLNVTRIAKFTGDLAQNVNFAIKPEMLKLFLEANQVRFRTAQLGSRLEGIVIASRAKEFTVQVICD